MLKQLREDGFSVTLFERRSRVGGVWAYSEDKSYTSALPSKFCGVVVVARSLFFLPLVSMAADSILERRAPTSANSHVASAIIRYQTVSALTRVLSLSVV
jgi:cation diffusion facilitator CzcD-associated flavoprotein CzcO